MLVFNPVALCSVGMDETGSEVGALDDGCIVGLGEGTRVGVTDGNTLGTRDGKLVDGE